MATVDIEIVEGRGSLIASRNGTIAATVNPGDGKVLVQYNIGDSFYFQAYPDTTLGYSFNKFCADVPCTISTTLNPFSGTITAETGYLGVYFTGTPATYNVVVRDNVGGKVDVYRNTRFVTSVTTSKVVNFFINDTFSFLAAPTSGYTFTKFCTDANCTQSTTSNPFTGTISTPSGSLNTIFTGTAPPPPSPFQCSPACTTDQYCVVGNCVPKIYVTYGALGFGALLILRLLKKR